MIASLLLILPVIGFGLGLFGIEFWTNKPWNELQRRFRHRQVHLLCSKQQIDYLFDRAKAAMDEVAAERRARRATQWTTRS